jgi:hypothetical protein
MMRLCALADTAVPVGDLCTRSSAFILSVQLHPQATSIFRTCCASPVAPLGNFCTDSLLEKTSILRTCCASPAAPLGDFCMDSLLGKTGFAHFLC